MNRKRIIAGLTAVVLLVIGIRFLIGGGEDTWICEKGSWVKYGNPSAPKPVTSCGEDITGLQLSPTVAIAAEASVNQLHTDDYTLSYPSDWEERKAVTGGVFMIGPKGMEDVWVGVGKVPYINASDTPDNLAKRSLGNYTLLSKDNLTISGHPAVVQKIRTGYGVRMESYIGEVQTAIKTPSGITSGVKGTLPFFAEIRVDDTKPYEDAFTGLISSIQFSTK